MCVCSITLSTSKSLLAVFNALAASFIVLSTAVLVFAPSNASLCISIVDKVPSICCSCLSYLEKDIHQNCNWCKVSSWRKLMFTFSFSSELAGQTSYLSWHFSSLWQLPGQFSFPRNPLRRIVNAWQENIIWKVYSKSPASSWASPRFLWASE